MSLTKKLTVSILLCVVFCAQTACTDYWWTRGQAPASDTLLERANLKLDSALESYSAKRPQVAGVAVSLRNSLDSALASKALVTPAPEALTAFKTNLIAGEETLFTLNDTVSIGSRASLGELSGQLRGIRSRAEKGDLLPEAAFELYSARLYSFLANELSMPAPRKPANT